MTSITAKCDRSVELRGFRSNLEILSCFVQAVGDVMSRKLQLNMSYNLFNSLTFEEKCKDGLSVGGTSWNVSWNVLIIRWTSLVLSTLDPCIRRDGLSELCEDAADLAEISSLQPDLTCGVVEYTGYDM